MTSSSSDENLCPTPTGRPYSGQLLKTMTSPIGRVCHVWPEVGEGKL